MTKIVLTFAREKGDKIVTINSPMKKYCATKKCGDSGRKGLRIRKMRESPDAKKTR